MNDKKLKQEHNAAADDHSDLDVGAMVEQIWNDLQGMVSRSAIRQALVEVVSKYENARIRTYVPIFVRREALETLRVELSEAAPARPFRAPGRLSVDTTPGGRTDKPYGLTTGIVLPENS
jgi:hypothetical protein